MPSIETALIKRAREFACSEIAKLDGKYQYHNTEHTEEVVRAAQEIGENSNLNDNELENVIVAAWFHDVGYACGHENHESESVVVMKKKLSEWRVKAEKIYEIGKIIESTKMPQSPIDLPSEVMCDADLYHLSTEQFGEKSEILRKELTDVCGKDLPPEKWHAITFDFISKHHYFTNYGKTVLEPKKQKNIDDLAGKHTSEK